MNAGQLQQMAIASECVVQLGSGGKQQCKPPAEIAGAVWLDRQRPLLLGPLPAKVLLCMWAWGTGDGVWVGCAPCSRFPRVQAKPQGEGMRILCCLGANKHK